jgi:apolipoprotein D and lipocalin family protein
MKHLLLLFTIWLTGCVWIPDDVKPVENFELEKYLGKWYEIARLDHSFERGLSRVTSDYSMRSDGGVKVVNRGYSAEKGSWRVAEGKAYFVKEPDLGYLKVSFFGPFYGAYVVLELDQERYQYSLVSGPDKNYLWILARSPAIKENIKNMLIAKAKALGFETNRLIYVKHE